MKNTGANTAKTNGEAAYFSVKEAAEYFGFSIFFVYSLLKIPNGPPYLKITTNKKMRPTIRIPKKEFMAWIQRYEGQSKCTS
jgi:hypothetical protein